MDWILRTEFWATFLTLTGLEIVLGIDNVIFHSLTISKLPVKYQKKARIAGMSLAVLLRFVLLAALFWFIGISRSLLVVLGNEISARDLVLISGGLFLVIKSCLELSVAETQKSHEAAHAAVPPEKAGIVSCIIQIVILDIVFSLDSVITAVGMVNDIRAIMLAIVVSVVVMMFCTTAVGKFLEERKRLRALAFCFIALVGAVLVAEGFDIVVPKSHIYVAGAFALLIEYGISRFSAHRQATRSARAAVLRRASLQYATVPAAAPPPDFLPESLSWNTQCNCQNPLSYGFCVECGDGLGTVKLDLGQVDYSPLLVK